MNRRIDVALASIAVIIVCLIMAFTSGCEEAEQKQSTWGNGNPPTSWQETFGNDNGARMDYMQMKILSQMEKRFKVLEDFCGINNDPNGR